MNSLETQNFSDEYIKTRMPINFRFPLTIDVSMPAINSCIIKHFIKNKNLNFMKILLEDLLPVDGNNNSNHFIELDKITISIQKTYDTLGIPINMDNGKVARFLVKELSHFAQDDLIELSRLKNIPDFLSLHNSQLSVMEYEENIKSYEHILTKMDDHRLQKWLNFLEKIKDDLYENEELLSMAKTWTSKENDTERRKILSLSPHLRSNEIKIYEIKFSQKARKIIEGIDF